MLQGLLSGAGLALDAATVEGQGEVASRFFVQFSGAGQTPVNNIQDFMRGLRLGDGKWKEVFVVDPEGENVQVFFSKDLGPKQEKMELLTKKLGEVFKQLYPKPEEKVWVVREEGVIKWNYQKLCCIDVLSADRVKLGWDSELQATSHFDKAKISDAFNAIAGNRSNIEWSWG